MKAIMKKNIALIVAFVLVLGIFTPILPGLIKVGANADEAAKIEAIKEVVVDGKNKKYEFIDSEESYANFVKEYYENSLKLNITTSPKIENEKIIDYKEDFFKDKKILVLYFYLPDDTVSLVGMEEYGKDIKLKIKDEDYYNAGDKNEYVFLIPVSKSTENVHLEYPYKNMVDVKSYLLFGVYANLAASIIYGGMLVIKKKEGWKECIIDNVGYMIISIFIYYIFSIPMVVFF